MDTGGWRMEDGGWTEWTCCLSMEAEPTGTVALGIQAANTEIAAGDVNDLHVPWYLPTRQIKTFHPRSPGMVGFRDAIIAAINSAQVNTAPTSLTTLAPKSTAPPKPTASASATTESPFNVAGAIMGGVFTAFAPEVSHLINDPREKCNTNYKFLWDTFDIYTAINVMRVSSMLVAVTLAVTGSWHNIVGAQISLNGRFRT